MGTGKTSTQENWARSQLTQQVAGGSLSLQLWEECAPLQCCSLRKAIFHDPVSWMVLWDTGGQVSIAVCLFSRERGWVFTSQPKLPWTPALNSATLLFL